MMGTIFPDFGTGRGRNKQISDLAHYVGSSLLPKLIYENAETEAWKAFALGWLLHVHMDINGHPFINRLAGEHKGGQEELTYEDDIALHAKLEFGLDLCLQSKFGEIDVTRIRFPDFIENPLSTAYILYYGIEITKAEIEGFKQIPKQMNWLSNLQKYFSKHKKQREFITKIANIISPGNAEMLDAIIHPIKQADDVIEHYLGVIEQAKNVLLDKGKPNWLKHNYNLDTGSISSIGDYKLADKMFKSVDRLMIPKQIIERYPDKAEKILANWESVRKEYNGNVIQKNLTKVIS